MIVARHDIACPDKRSTADGEITQSDHPFGDDELPLGTVRLTFSPADDTVQIKLSDAHAYTFCGPNAQPGLCGA
jgi:hypothetical protein